MSKESSVYLSLILRNRKRPFLQYRSDVIPRVGEQVRVLNDSLLLNVLSVTHRVSEVYYGGKSEGLVLGWVEIKVKEAAV